jgi:tetratricopeptide (TPR) repeat protein
MYVRPETISLLYISVVMSVLFHWRKHPRAMWLLPPVFLCWVNTQGLFVLGFILMGAAIAEAAFDPAMYQRSQRPWWARVVATTGLCLIACLFNPYGLKGLFFPLELAGTMRNPIFRTIGELMPVPQFIQSLGYRDFPLTLNLATLPKALSIISRHFFDFPLPLKMQLATMFFCFLSFILPILGGFLLYFRQNAGLVPEVVDNEAPLGSKKNKNAKMKMPPKSEKTRLAGLIRFSLFRFLLFLFFSLLSLQATRNSHQFGAVLGTITAANFAQFASLTGGGRKKGGSRLKTAISPGNSIAMALMILTTIWVSTGQFYQDSAEGRTIGLGPEPLWFPHEAIKAAGADGLPPRFASFHNGHAALYDYYWGPEKKVFSDARLEVIGPDLYTRQIRLTNALSKSEPAWKSLVAAADRPVMLADHQANSTVSVTLMTASDYACIHFDPVAAVFAPAESLPPSKLRPFDFRQAHFSPDGFRARSFEERLALARALRNIAGGLSGLSRDDLAAPMNLAGISLCSNLAAEEPTLFDAWKLKGQLLQAANAGSAQRDSAPQIFDPLGDLALVRSLYALKRAAELNPDDFSNLFSLVVMHRGLEQPDLELSALLQLTKLKAINTTQSAELENAVGRIATLRQLLADRPEAIDQEPANRADLQKKVAALMGRGQTRQSAELMENSLPQDGSPNDLLQLSGSLWLWQGEPEKARKAFERISDEPLRQMLLACCWIIENRPQESAKLLEEARAFDQKKTVSAELQFDILALQAQQAMESGELTRSRADLQRLQNYAVSPKQRDFTAKMRNLVLPGQ